MNENDMIGAIAALNRDIDQAFEAVLVGEHLNIRSRRAKSRVFLLFAPVSQHDGILAFRLIRHYSPELTRQHKGEIFSRGWILRFTTAYAQEAASIDDITYKNIPSDCQIVKETKTKTVIRDKFGSTITIRKDGAPKHSLTEYDGKHTRSWERHEVGVINWYYDSD